MGEGSGGEGEEDADTRKRKCFNDVLFCALNILVDAPAETAKHLCVKTMSAR